ncbi:MAG: DNA repair exonuclease [Armatimonadota bacterium]|nr:DNA repair exonuclease [Armatimonadota bacterium]MDR7464280.1 DNA repair exonuclease [Armatimonadota bacterium]MDR7468776.1 DNA repair exonuclease [Armatimonadota bacterium]MDR7473703.1 DNA repair exonuclease [Armatimonadota bacterium]MDR7538603.1 DNA repair exonuclease [Armatimonadota bacterium]
MISLLHTADVHLGMGFPGLGAHGREHREQLRRTFARIVDLALQQRVDLLLVAGDLFDSQRQSEATLAFVREQFLRLRDGGIRVVLLAGNHDPLGEESVWSRARFEATCDNVTLFGAQPQTLILPDLDLTVIGQSVGPDGPQPLRGWPQERTTQFAVGLAHGSAYREGVVEAGTIHPADVRRLGLDYLALGDWHSTQAVTGPPTPAWYAGAPEFLAMDQEAGQVLLVTIPQPGQAQVRPVRVGRRSYRRVEVDITGLDPDRVRAAAMGAAGPDVVLDVVLTGMAPPHRLPQVRDLEEALQEACFRARVRNQVTVWLEEEALEAFPERTLVGRYIRLMRERAATAPPQERPILEEALQVGVAMLLGAEEP